mmetsp:Transcript_15410/g.31278  ORF Transcript_15410/g.31278 Transcript_15410/m.31278 type:complete len:90 (-) Transcript_15410:424-693(-)
MIHEYRMSLCTGEGCAGDRRQERREKQLASTKMKKAGRGPCLGPQTASDEESDCTHIRKNPKNRLLLFLSALSFSPFLFALSLFLFNSG